MENINLPFGGKLLIGSWRNIKFIIGIGEIEKLWKVPNKVIEYFNKDFPENSVASIGII